ncbi:hypothetical protein ONZ43_g405 [Nemania bipapillata]|uniref:Uncharacterized protein n=1 Tax=Nemania bipapillata TaxID=110536 RepID=A0ACC2J950_9PEZI|nr:hypothetical protein ONZ43_g405 [Nemania bipapillata]
MSNMIHKSVLLIGYRSSIPMPQYFRERFGTPEEIRAKLAHDQHRIQRAGITSVMYQLNELDQEKGLRELEGLLRKGNYDAIGIGAGVRLHPDYTALFETIVNMCRTIAPSAPLMFNDGPDGSADTSEWNLEL